MAVLSKAGCSAGTCHGNKNGKGGFKLSLRGQDPDIDYVTLTRGLFGLRVNAFDAEQSLVLLKPTTQVSHDGGLRFKRDSEEYKIVRAWIASGMPNDLASAPKLQRIVVTPAEKVLVEPASEVQLQVQAQFAGGLMRNVTPLAVYEPVNSVAKVSHDGLVRGQSAGEVTVLVRYLHCQEAVRLAFVPTRPGFTRKAPATKNYIDEQVFKKLRTLRINPSPTCSDEMFARRAYLDLLGILPTVEEARNFLADRKRDKRERLVEALLDRPEFADFWALKWADLLRVEAHSLDQKGVQSFHAWIRQSIATNKPLDQFVRELITARGSTYRSPAANYYRPNRDPLTRARSAAQLFVGTRLQCAECHNHPFDRWTQDDYYDWAGLFARVRYKVIENKREISSDEHEWNGEQIVFLAQEGSVKNPRTGKAARPRFLGETNPPGLDQTSDTSDAAEAGQPVRSLGGEQDRTRPRGARRLGGLSDGSDELEALANWLTSPTNMLFASVQANRIWHHLMGRGLVDPPDDFRATNPASHPALLDALAHDFVKHGFDMRYLIRLIMNSHTYQLASEPNETNQSDEINFARALVRRLGAEQLLDCESQVI